jgi:hypothetical protein
MGKKLTWVETYRTTVKYSAQLTDEEAELFENNPDKFWEEVDYSSRQELEWDDVSGNEVDDFEIEE